MNKQFLAWLEAEISIRELALEKSISVQDWGFATRYAGELRALKMVLKKALET